MLKNLRILRLLGRTSGVVIVLLVSRNPQGLFTDPSWQLKAMQQYMALWGPFMYGGPRNGSRIGSARGRN